MSCAGAAKTAVVVGATNGIGKAISCRLAQEGFRIIAVGRDNEEGNRREEVLKYLEQCSAGDGGGTVQHEFRPCDAFELSQVQSCARGIVRDHASESSRGVDALVMTQGMATLQGFTPTAEGNDQKLALHFWSRAAFASCLLPALRPPPSGAASDGGPQRRPVVLSVLSGGVHSPYKKYRDDPELKKNYSIKTAADCAGYYNDLFFDALARRHPAVGFVHACPGLVASKWGTEMPAWLRVPIRGMQRVLGKSPEKCAGVMVGPILRGAHGEGGLGLAPPARRAGDAAPSSDQGGLYVMNEDGTSGTLSKGHTEEAMESVWGTTKDVLGRAGIDLN